MSHPNSASRGLKPLALILAVATPALGFAAAGDLDSSFAGKGWTVSDIGNLKDNHNYALGSVVQADGKLVLVGQDNNGKNNDIALTRLTTSGALDTTFSGDGRLTLAAGIGTDVGYSVIEQADGKLVVTGTSDIDVAGTTVTQILLARFNSDGTLDNAFGSGGMVLTAVSSTENIGRDVLQQADGKLVVVGTATGTNNDIAVVRYNTDGSLDTSFDTDGIATFGVLAADDLGYSIIQQADGKLAITGEALAGATTDIAVLRLNSNGSLDTSFDADGKLTFNIGTVSTTPSSTVTISTASPAAVSWTSHGLAVNTAVSFTTTGTLPTGLSVGTTYYIKTSSANSFTVSATPGGTAINTTAAGTGTHTCTGPTTVTNENDHGYAILQQADGKLVVGGDAINGTFTDMAVARLNTDGSFDTGFGTAGIAKTAIGTRSETIRDIVQQADGKLVAGGYAYTTNNDFAVVRYNSNGTLDTSFSGDGIQTVAVNTANDDAYSTRLQADGRILMAGLTRVGTTDDLGVIRLNSDGSLDAGYASSGKLTLTGGSTESKGYAVIQQADGKLVAGGYANVTGNLNDFALARYNLDGTLDTTFSGDGWQTTSFVSNQIDQLNSLIQQTDGKLVAAGYFATTTTNYSIALARFNSDGSLDTSFDSDGKYNTQITTNDDVINDVIQLQNGQLMATGYVNSSTARATSSDFALMRFNTNGLRDNSFGGIGSRTYNISNLVYAATDRDQAQSLIEDNAGKLVVVGTVRDNNVTAPTGYNIVVARFAANGDPDTTFDGDGIAILDVALDDDYAYDVIQDSNGKYLVSGTTYAAGSDNFIVARYNQNGSLDTSFGGSSTGYKLVPVTPGAEAHYSSITEQPDGKIVLGSYTTINNVNHPTLVRLLPDGTLDSGFATGGQAVASTGKDAVARAVVVQQDGKYLLVGNTLGPTGLMLTRLQTEDQDSDGMGDLYDNCPAVANADQLNFDNDQLGDACDSDADGDLAPDSADNCLLLANLDQFNTDGDSQGNACDDDDDNDGVLDVSDAFPLDGSESVDTDGDGIGNNADGDDDGDGAADAVDVEPLNAGNATEIDLPLDNPYDGARVKDSQLVD